MPQGDKAGLSADFAIYALACVLKGLKAACKWGWGLIASAATGSVRATREVCCEAGSFVKDTVVGVIQGTSEVAKTTTPVVLDGTIGEARPPGGASSDPDRSRRSLERAEGSNEHYSNAIGHLAKELPKATGAWRVSALWRAGRTLVEIGGIDLSASLAYYTLLSFFPLAALTIIVFAAFIDPETVRGQLWEALIFYFPASEEILGRALDHLFQSRLAASIVAVIGILIGANGLFMAANRAVNRVFGVRPRRVVGTTLVQMSLTAVVLALFLGAISLTTVLGIAMNVSEALPVAVGPVGWLPIFIMQAASAIVPSLLTALVFLIVYRTLPNQPVRWGDATFGAIVAVVLFEAARHLFFWFTSLVTQRSLVYGSLSSVIILLIWSNVAGLIFLYGASLTKESAGVRPLQSELV